MFDPDAVTLTPEVAPFTGAWIEIRIWFCRTGRIRVAPFTGAWIEISSLTPMSLLMLVAPFTGAWIEIKQR